MSHAQQRYLDSGYVEIRQSTYDYHTTDGETLKLDVFDPINNPSSSRPVLLYVHGGGFAGGKRDQPAHVTFCKRMAARGYVSVTMSYTLLMKGKSFGCDRPAPEKIKTFLHTAQDISRAVAFLTHRAEELRIDPSQVVLLGSSAGAEAILHAAYWKRTFADDSGQILPSDFAYAGLVSMAGAITSLDWIHVDSAIPTQMFHGTCDNLVPYGRAPHHYCEPDRPGYLVLHGSRAIYDHMIGLGKGVYLVTGCHDGHEWNSDPLAEQVEAITDFVYYDILEQQQRQIHIVYPSDKQPCPTYNAYNYCR